MILKVFSTTPNLKLSGKDLISGAIAPLSPFVFNMIVCKLLFGKVCDPLD